jgi:hypothetical protein
MKPQLIINTKGTRLHMLELVNIVGISLLTG